MQFDNEQSQQLAACQSRVAELEQQLVKEAERMRQSDEDFREFAHAAAHDFREPLRAIVSYTQLLELRYGKQLDETAHEFIQQVINSAQSMNALTDALVTYARASTGGPDSRNQTDLNGVIAGVMLELDEKIRASGATIQCGQLPTVRCDEQSLHRLFYELLSNSLLYRSDHPPLVEISASEAGELWEIAVADNGIGIDANYQDRIFGLFKRLHGRSLPGIGLGLAICRKIVERQGGRMWVESQPAHGATFRFTLPS